MIFRCLRVLLFYAASTLQVSIVDAKDYTIPTESPKNCIKSKSLPCAVSTGDQPRMFQWVKSSWELDRHLVLETDRKEVWNVYQGLLVVNSKKPLKIHTPFADIQLGHSKVMIHVLKNKVRVLSLNGEGVKVKPKGESEEHFLVPGFQNWFGGVNNGSSESGVVSVIDFESFAQDRARFFMDHQYGYIQELQQVAKTVKWAAIQASQMHRDLVQRKMASLEVKHQEKIQKKRQKIQFNKYLRKLFLQKIRYDY